MSSLMTDSARHHKDDDDYYNDDPMRDDADISPSASMRVFDASYQPLGHNGGSLSSTTLPLPAATSKQQAIASARFLDICSCLLYASISIMMIIFNKLILAKYKFNYNFTLIFIQNACAAICVALFARFNTAGIKVEKLQYRLAMRWLPLNIIFVCMLLTSTLSLKYVSVPMITVFKNLSLTCVYIGDILFFDQLYDHKIMASQMLMVLGFIFAAWQDLHFSAVGYFWSFMNVFLTAANVLYTRNLSDDLKLSSFGSVLYNNTLSLPFLFTAMILQGEVPAVFRAEQLSDPTFCFILVISGLLGFFISLSSFWCIQRTSSTTFSMVGASNKIPLAFIGVLIFNTKMTNTGAIATYTALIGCVAYFAVKAKK